MASPRGVRHLAAADAPITAVIEQIIADPMAGPLARLPSGKFVANSAWRAPAATGFNLARALAALAGGQLTTATTATVRTRIITAAARSTRSARHTTLRGPTHWPWAEPFNTALTATTGPPRHG